MTIEGVIQEMREFVDGRSGGGKCTPLGTLVNGWLAVIEAERAAVEALTDERRRLHKLIAEKDNQLGRKLCQHARCMPYAQLQAENAILRRAAEQAAHDLEILRIWGGMGWDWTSPAGKKAWAGLRSALNPEDPT